MPTNGKTPLLTQIKEALGMNAKDFMREWRELSDQDKANIKSAVENGSMTY